MRQALVKGVLVVVVLTGSEIARAQEAAGADGGVEPTAAPGASSSEGAPAAEGADAGRETSAAGGDGVRFRFGVSGGPGLFTAKTEVGSQKASFTYGGIDLRFGAQINDLLGVYGQPTLGYYSSGDADVLAIGGLLGLAVLADVTLVDRVFVGAGVGYTVYNNPAGVSPILRVGAYPLMGESAKTVRRRGLMVGVDLRVTKVEAIKTIVMPTLNVGYEAF